MDLQLTGKSALVTGGTKGIGRAIVETFLEEGAQVAFCARNPEEVSETEKALGGKGPRVIGTVLDVGDAQGVARWVEDSASAFGGIDIVVNNVSALAIPDTEENWQASIAVDLMGTVHVCKAALPYLERSGSPSIVNISSVSGREVDFAGGPYGTVKSAIIAYTAHLAFAHASKGIRANTVSPGNTYFPGGVWESIEHGNPELFKMAMDLNPTGRMGTTQDTANAVAFLSSPRAGRISGTNLVVDGALTRGIQF
ncbi:MAG: SDR family NAD(P)-dependent oxidoreductase [Actinomycetota bacterium]|nr:SDR family NAD(P)-dependent oxidoreductase [Actinomycetota bacterium]MDA8208757.1 SDR family NAD(P)-dependent oxidoreductase [Actinomycetota bacterium]